MAENITTERQDKTGKRPHKSTRVDLTPMVDLGFLLITFFVFTTSMTLPKAMNMDTPYDKNIIVNDPVCESCALTVFPVSDNQLYYYEGSEKNAVYKKTDYSPIGLRALMMKKKKEATAIGRNAVLIIKPGKKSSFKNLVDIIDETTITEYKKYYLDQVTNNERSNTEQ